MIKSLDADFVKVDGSIVRNILKSQHALTRLSAALRAGDVIGVGVIAERVEDRDVLVRRKVLGAGSAGLRHMHCWCRRRFPHRQRSDIPAASRRD